MSLKSFAVFLALRMFKAPRGLRSPVPKPVRCRLVLSLPSLGALARGAQIDEVAHVKLGAFQCCGLAILALVWNNYADTVTLDHSNRQPMGSQSKLP